MRLLVPLALILAMGTADARPRAIVVLEFDGEPVLAERGRALVLALMSDRYDLVTPKHWVVSDGPDRWRRAAKRAGVDAVLEGWVDTQGSRHRLNVQVRDANGIEIDLVSIRFDGQLTTETKRQLADNIDDMLGWCELPVEQEIAKPSPPTRPIELTDPPDADQQLLDVFYSK